MKKLLCLPLLLWAATPLLAQEELDLSAIKSIKELTAFREQLIKNNQAGLSTQYYTYLDSALWNKVMVHDVSLKKDGMTMNVKKSTLNGTKNIITFLQKQYPAVLEVDTSWYKRTYSVKNTLLEIKMESEVDEGKAVASGTPSELEIRFKPVYEAPYPVLAQTLAKNPDGIFYFLDFDCLNNNIEIFVNGVSIYHKTGRHQYDNSGTVNLNPFILGKEETSVKVVITPGLDEEGKPFATIQKRSYAEVILQKGIFKPGSFETLENREILKHKEYVTDTLVEDGDTVYSSYLGNAEYGAKQWAVPYNFIAAVSYANSGWSNGSDLRNDKRLNDKITGLYKKLEQAIRQKDALALSNLFYQMGKERLTAGYNQEAADYIDEWTGWMDMLEYANVIRIENDFDIEISEDGRLIYAKPKKQLDMLRVIGKKQAEGFTYYMYEDKTTGELKFIR